jgi:hypothetical protein
MSETSIAFLGYIVWMMVLVFIIVGIRVQMVLSGKRRANNFNPDGKDVSEFSARVARVHANCYEHFPIFGGILILSLVLKTQEITNTLALYFLAARILQGLIHLFSTHVMAVNIRFTFFILQYAIAVVWVYQLLKL